MCVFPYSDDNEFAPCRGVYNLVCDVEYKRVNYIIHYRYVWGAATIHHTPTSSLHFRGFKNLKHSRD